MDCRPGCGACCIAPSISSALPGMPHGKPAGTRCANLSTEGMCGVWGTPDYPPVCRGFVPQRAVCGETRSEAMHLLAALESSTSPDPGPEVKDISASWASPAPEAPRAAASAALSYAVILADDASFRPGDIARALAAARKAPLLDFMVAMRRAWGIVEEGVTKAAAEATAAALGAAGIKALAIPSGLLEEAPSPERATNLTLSAGGLTYAEREAPARHADWRRLVLVAAAGVSVTTEGTAAPAPDPADVAKKMLKTGFSLMTGMPTSLGMGPKPVEKKAAVTDQVYVVDLLLKGPPQRLRLEGNRFDFSCLGARKGYNILANVKVLVSALAAAAPAAALNRGSQVMLDGRPLREMGYDGLGDLEREERWRLTLAALRPG